jgi:hypothetical protein
MALKRNGIIGTDVLTDGKSRKSGNANCPVNQERDGPEEVDGRLDVAFSRQYHVG